MKSKLFASFDLEREESKRFQRDLRAILDEGDVRNTALALYPSYRLARTGSEKNDILETWREETGGSVVATGRGLTLIDFFVMRHLDENLNPEDDTPDNWADDLVEVGCIEEKDRPGFVELAGRIRNEVLPSINDEIKRRSASEGLLPTMTSFKTTVELRAVHEAKVKSHTSADEYEPKVSDVASVVSISIGLDTRDENSFFQADEDDVDFMINKLRRAKKDLAALRRFCGR